MVYEYTYSLMKKKVIIKSQVKHNFKLCALLKIVFRNKLKNIIKKCWLVKKNILISKYYF